MPKPAITPRTMTRRAAPGTEPPRGPCRAAGPLAFLWWNPYIAGTDDGMLKPVEWVGSSKADLKRFPDLLQDRMGFAIYRAQAGLRHRDAKPLRGFGAGVLEVVRAMTATPFGPSTRSASRRRSMSCMPSRRRPGGGLPTPRKEIDLVRRRLRAAEQHYRDTQE